MHFTDLGIDTRLETQLAHQGITQPTDIQAHAVPTALAGHDIFAQSKTGSGKTLAFLLPAVQRVMKQKALSKRDPRVLIVAPTRELATQVFTQLRLLIAGTAIKAVKVLGGENFNDQIKALRNDPQFVVATPGRLADHVTKRSLQLSGLELLIFDEADRILDLGFTEQLKLINDEANHRLRQTLLFSATLDHAQVDALSRNLLKKPKQITLSAANEQHSDITQTLYLADHLDHKEALLTHFLKQDEVGQCIIFTATRADTSRLSEELNNKGFKSVALAGDLTQSKRLDIMDSFSRGNFKILITTDVASRGLDLLSVTHVINFDLPKHAEEYVHRIGRTGRAGFKGTAISLVGPKDWASYLSIKSFLNDELKFASIDGLKAKFKGIKEKKPASTLKAKKVTQVKKPQIKRKAKPKKPVAPIKAPMNIDGDSPMRRKKKPEQE
ncbi:MULTISPECIES: DEAD/DEAH box helicase [unclassified Pseudoalteromonas]|uniref:DEAD/DEAH box helicase n=1 Tax=unclassified Pseudoalteromonas TaxID=194690 RepID=UPI0011090159|nr:MULTISPECIES: DEAD/DEAH box helicase [unclassified Pseudoalteromonas]TMN82830.1 RNA helicase [Pseudoalteromonas sp. S410]TMN92594.1 RNA helicase [Pseudoalteromonas sp. S408]TMN97615.1 RNA helicase [Pseudoalteromonas sp. S409]TMO00918.1 RNA helicase [Pseudoalteromonas sp. S407]TMO11620.1 RNA helicase [Pseudoalteromonas sp. S186]